MMRCSFVHHISNVKSNFLRYFSTGLECLHQIRANSDTNFAVIIVKKKTTDGNWCKKCIDIGKKIEEDGLDRFIGHTAVADLSNTTMISEGIALARKFKVNTAPFFLLRSKIEEQAGQNWTVVQSYLELKKILLKTVSNEQPEFYEFAAPIPGLPCLGRVPINRSTGFAVVMIKKRNQDGEFCRKCRDIETKLVSDQFTHVIGYTAVADVNDGESEGIKLANHFEVATAPFFLIRHFKSRKWQVINSYLHLKKLFEVASTQDSFTCFENNGQMKRQRQIQEIKSQIQELTLKLQEIESMAAV